MCLGPELRGLWVYGLWKGKTGQHLLSQESTQHPAFTGWWQSRHLMNFIGWCQSCHLTNCHLMKSTGRNFSFPICKQGGIYMLSSLVSETANEKAHALLCWSVKTFITEYHWKAQQQKRIFSQFWRLEDQDECGGRISFSWGLSRVVDGYLLCVFTCPLYLCPKFLYLWEYYSHGIRT